MPFYRCYNIATDGSTIGLQNFQALTDAEANAVADKIRYDGLWYGLEMWEGCRVVCRLSARPLPPGTK
jgi:hypothetical protein